MVIHVNYIDRLKIDYKFVDDLVIKNINNVYVIYIDSLSNQDKINEYILKNLSLNIKVLPSPKVIDINNYDSLKEYLNIGFAIIIDKNKTIAIEVKENLSRSISDATSEKVMFGPKESLTENLQTNIGLIKRRIKNNNLKNINIPLGRYSKTTSSTLYVKGIVKYDLVKNIISKLKKIDVDGLYDVSEIKKALIDDNENIFPSIKVTERPDVIEDALLSGKVVILLDTSPYALILPSVFADFINPISDNYSKSININFTKILRFICFFLSILIPSFYIAITNYNQEAIPLNLLKSFQEQRMSVPFPSYIECMLVLLICEILKESDIRFPSTYGSAVSILGAITLGDAAVNAGIVSPIMIIIVAFSFISSMIFTDTDMASGIRYFRFITLIICSFFGLYGLFISIIFLFVYLLSKETFNMPYMYPISPFDKSYIKNTIIKMKNKKRSKYLTKNIIKGEL